jgi:shikimate dehydrogenase
MKNIFGLLGKTLKHSFSKGFFTEKFEKEGIAQENQYELFELATIEEFPQLIKKYKGQIKGLNVTIPYKQAIMPFLDEIDEAAGKIGAVNTIKFLENGITKGYNTDYWGFRWTIEKWGELQSIQPKKALVLGNGGAAKAVIVALQDLGVEVTLVSRKPNVENTSMAEIGYSDLTKSIVYENLLIVNTTPLGMYPDLDSFPEIPYNLLNDKYLLYDLVYNPLETTFLKKGREFGANIHFGLEMLHGQAEKAWGIWGEK